MKTHLSLALAVLAAACSNPTAPTAVPEASTTLSTELTGAVQNPRPCSESAVEFHDDMSGTAFATNLSACEHTYTLIVWEFRSDLDQTEVARHTIRLAPGQRGMLSLAYRDECGKVYQRDVFLDLPPIPDGQKYSLLDALQHTFWVAGRLIYAAPCPGTPLPPTPVPPTPPQPPTPPNPPTPPVPPADRCERAAFAQIGEMTVSGGLASIQLRLKTGRGPFEVYLLSYASRTPFPVLGGRVVPTFPQTLVEQRRFTVRPGPSQTFSIPIPAEGAAWQIDAGCVPGPSLLRGRRDYPPEAFLEAAVGNR